MSIYLVPEMLFQLKLVYFLEPLDCLNIWLNANNPCARLCDSDCCLFNLVLIILPTPVHPVAVTTVQLGQRPTVTPTNPCLCALIRTGVR